MELAPYEQLRNQDLAEMANIMMSRNRGVNVANYIRMIYRKIQFSQQQKKRPTCRCLKAMELRMSNCKIKILLKRTKFPTCRCLKCQRIIASCRWTNKTSRIKVTCNVTVVTIITVPIVVVSVMLVLGVKVILVPDPCDETEVYSVRLIFCTL